MRALLVAAAALAAALAAAPGPARAQEGGAPPASAGRVEEQLARGLEQFQELEYRDAIDTLRPVRLDQEATRAQRLQALELIGISHLILDEKARAEEAFEDLLTLDPGYQLQHDDGAPKIREFFDSVRKKVVPNSSGGMETRLEHAAPSEAIAGRTVEIEAVVKSGLSRVAEMVVRWRRRGVLGYDSAPMRREPAAGGAGERWRTRFVPPPSRTPYAVDYYVEARNAAGGAVGRIGGPDSPLALPVAPGEPVAIDRPRPWYTRWYVIAGGAAVLGVASAAIVISAGGDAPDGSLGSITLSP